MCHGGRVGGDNQLYVPQTSSAEVKTKHGPVPQGASLCQWRRPAAQNTTDVGSLGGRKVTAPLKSVSSRWLQLCPLVLSRLPRFSRNLGNLGF